KALLTEASKLLGTDGRKMSKSYGNTIALSDDEEQVNKKVLSMKTDTQRVKKSIPGRPEVCNVFSYHKFFTDQETVKQIDLKCRNAEIGCIECKKILAENLNKFLLPIREKRKELEKDRQLLDKIICEGNEKAKEVASKTMEEVKEAMGLMF
ncbi:MAG: tryptophan--tRNA ligase, partial [Sulfurihydrogenibium azorense]